MKDINKILKNNYGVEDIVKKDIDAILARNQFVEKNEEKRSYHEI